MGQPVSVLIASDVQSTATRIKTALLRLGLDCPHANVVSLELALHVASEQATDVFFVVMSPDRAKALDALTQVRALVGSKLVAVGAGPSPKDVLDAIHAGADDYLDAADEFDAELEALLKRVRSARCAPAPSGRAITIASAIGGGGTSTLAVNLAAALAQRCGPCGLLDLHWPNGDLTMLLNLKPHHSLDDLCRNSTSLDPTSFAQALIRHDCGIALLAGAAEAPGRDGPVTVDALAQLLQLARTAFSNVVVDLGHVFDEKQLRMVQMSDLIMIVVRLNVVAMLKTKQNIEFLLQSGIDDERIGVVANRFGQASELSVKTAESALGRRITHLLPDDPRTVNTSINVGHPAVLEAPTAKVSKAIQRLCDDVLSRLGVAAPALKPDGPSGARGVLNRISQIVAERPRRGPALVEVPSHA
jgi:pilus assembly protein CpaE